VNLLTRQFNAAISISQVARYLEQADLQPHKNQQWLNTKEKDSEAFQQQVETVCQAYLDAPQLYHRENTHTVSVDEMTGVQALERIAPTIPMKSGRPERFEFEYKRHGTLCLIANWHVVIGQMIAPTIGPTRKEEDFQKHVSRTVATDPDAGWRFMVDRLNTHCRQKRQVWNSQIDGFADGVSLGHQPSSPFHLLAQAHFMAQSDRDHFLNRYAAGSQTRRLQIAGGSGRTFANLYRLLQPNFRQAIQLDLHRTTRKSRHTQTPKNLEGKMDKQKERQEKIILGGKSIMISDTRFLIWKLLVQFQHVTQNVF